MNWLFKSVLYFVYIILLLLSFCFKYFICLTENINCKIKMLGLGTNKFYNVRI